METKLMTLGAEALPPPTLRSATTTLLSTDERQNGCGLAYQILIKLQVFNLWDSASCPPYHSFLSLVYLIPSLEGFCRRTAGRRDNRPGCGKRPPSKVRSAGRVSKRCKSCHRLPLMSETLSASMLGVGGRNWHVALVSSSTTAATGLSFTSLNKLNITNDKRKHYKRLTLISLAGKIENQSVVQERHGGDFKIRSTGGDRDPILSNGSEDSNLPRYYQKRIVTAEIEKEGFEDVVEELDDKFRESGGEEGALKSSRASGPLGHIPLVSALKSSAKRNAASFHFPGHNKGHAAPSALTDLIGLRPFIHDLPELPELDNLFSPEGPILEAQRMAAELFGSSETWFLVGGTTCGIQAAIMATCSPGEYIVVPRNCHVSALSAMVLSGAVPKYIVPEYDCRWDIAVSITSEQVARAMNELHAEGHKPAAVFVTSPTYHGICSNVSEICQLCHAHGIPLIVDEAHGAHLGFHPQMPHSALQQGADLVVQSTHKVLSSLTQSSMLHMSGDIVNREKISRCLQTLQSTSPSYLLLASLDATRAQIGQDPHNIFSKALELATELKALIQQIPGIDVLDSSSFTKYTSIDPLRLTIGFWRLGLSGYEADDILDRDHGVVSELVGTHSMTFAINLGTSREHADRLVLALRQLSDCSMKTHVAESRAYAPFSATEMILSPRDAFFGDKRRVSFGESLGKVCGELVCPYPPGIPVLIPGEVITETALDYLSHVKREGAVVTGASDPQLSSLLICDL